MVQKLYNDRAWPMPAAIEPAEGEPKEGGPAGGGPREIVPICDHADAALWIARGYRFPRVVLKQGWRVQPLGRDASCETPGAFATSLRRPAHG